MNKLRRSIYAFIYRNSIVGFVDGKYIRNKELRNNPELLDRVANDWVAFIKRKI